MVPNASEIARRRLTITSVLRLFALAVLVAALVPIIAWLAEGITDGDLLDVSYYLSNFITAAVIFPVSVVFWVAAPGASRLVVPTPRFTRCPGCAYKIEGLTAPVCPECGLPLTAEFLSSTADPPARTARSETILLRQIVAAVIRFVSVISVFVLVLWLVFSIMKSLQYGDWSLELLSSLINAGLCVVAFVAAPWLARWIVPGPSGVRNPGARPAIASAFAASGLLVTLVSAWKITGETESRFPIFTLPIGAGLIVAAFPIADRARRGARQKGGDRSRGTPPLGANPTDAAPGA